MDGDAMLGIGAPAAEARRGTDCPFPVPIISAFYTHALRFAHTSVRLAYHLILSLPPVPFCPHCCPLFAVCCLAILVRTPRRRMALLHTPTNRALRRAPPVITRPAYMAHVQPRRAAHRSHVAVQKNVHRQIKRRQEGALIGETCWQRGTVSETHAVES